MPRVLKFREADSKARVTLPKDFAGSPVIVERLNKTDVLIRMAAVVPVSRRKAELPPLTTLQPLSDEARDEFLAALDSPPQPNEALKRLMRGE